MTCGSSICCLICRRGAGTPDLRQYPGLFSGFFLDFFEISFIILPLLAPVADKLGIDLVWFGILMG